MATIKEIAKACNVSIATVSNILNGKPGASEATRSLVLKTVEKMDYTPNYVAKNLKMKNTRSIGVIAEDMLFSVFRILLTALQNIVRKSIIRFCLRTCDYLKNTMMCITARKIIMAL